MTTLPGQVPTRPARARARLRRYCAEGSSAAVIGRRSRFMRQASCVYSARITFSRSTASSPAARA